MQAGRFVTLCFLYCGLIFLAQYVVFFGFSFELDGATQLGVGVLLLAAGVIRLNMPKEEDQNPAEYGPFAYGMAAFSLILTAILLMTQLL